jgi:hypothetical protein
MIKAGKLPLLAEVGCLLRRPAASQGDQEPSGRKWHARYLLRAEQIPAARHGIDLVLSRFMNLKRRTSEFHRGGDSGPAIDLSSFVAG